MIMFNNIAFIGGIHGVGKSTICHQICSELKIEYLSASEVLNAAKLTEVLRDKRVENICENQEKLIVGLRKVIQKSKFYLLDGHFCLLDKKSEIINIPLATFKAFKPISLNVIIGDVSIIKNRLETRDKKIYEIKLLEKMQINELNQAKAISKQLELPLNIGNQERYSEILKSISDSYKNKV